MSAFTVNAGHIRYLVTAAESMEPSRIDHNFQWFYNGALRTLGQDVTETELGQILWDENMRSVNYRYAANPAIEDETGTYKHIPMRLSAERGREMNLAQVFQSISCLEYQSCETPDWEQSEAYAVLIALRGRVAKMLPGYNDTDWGAPAIFNEV